MPKGKPITRRKLFRDGRDVALGLTGVGAGLLTTELVHRQLQPERGADIALVHQEFPEIDELEAKGHGVIKTSESRVEWVNFTPYSLNENVVTTMYAFADAVGQAHQGFIYSFKLHGVQHDIPLIAQPIPTGNNLVVLVPDNVLTYGYGDQPLDVPTFIGGSLEKNLRTAFLRVPRVVTPLFEGDPFNSIEAVMTRRMATSAFYHRLGFTTTSPLFSGADTTSFMNESLGLALSAKMTGLDFASYSRLMESVPSDIAVDGRPLNYFQFLEPEYSQLPIEGFK